MNQKLGAKKKDDQIHEEVTRIYDERIVPNVAKIQEIFLNARAEAMAACGIGNDEEGNDVNVLRAFAQGWGHCALLEAETVMNACGMSPQLQVMIIMRAAERIAQKHEGTQRSPRPKGQPQQLKDGTVISPGGVILPGLGGAPVKNG